MILTDEEKRMVDGEYGPGVQQAMNLLVRYGEAFDAEKMVAAASAHAMVDGPPSHTKGMLEGTGARIPATLHAGLGDPRPLPELGVSQGVDVEKLSRQYAERLHMFRRAGCLLSSTCTPYLVGNIPRKGDIASWVGSSGQVIVNSWFGVKINRDGASVTLACAITGRIPYIGVLRPENRYGEVLVEMEGLDADRFAEAHYGALAYYVGGIAGSRNVVVDGLPASLTFERFKHLCSPLPVSGAVSICHVAGVTPEARTLEQALGNKKPAERITVGRKQIEEAWEALTTAEDGTGVNLVTLGCPHLTVLEIREIASLLKGKKVHPDVRLTLGTSKSVYAMARSTGYADIIGEAGGIVLDTCVGGGHPLVVFGDGGLVAATNSPRAAHYMARMNDVEIFYGDTRDCIDAAITGKWRGRTWK